MKTRRWTLALGMSMLALSCSSEAHAGWLTVKTQVPRLKGKVVDKVTGAPVSDAVVEVEWGWGSLKWGGDLGGGYGAETWRTVMDEDGTFQTPSKSKRMWFGGWVGMAITRLPEIRVYHPLYEAFNYSSRCDQPELQSELIWDGSRMAKGNRPYHNEPGLLWEGKLQLRQGGCGAGIPGDLSGYPPSDLVVKMLSLGEKAKRESEKCAEIVAAAPAEQPGGAYKKSGIMCPNLYSAGGDYFSIAEKAGVPLKTRTRLKQAQYHELIALVTELIPNSWPYKEKTLASYRQALAEMEGR